MLPPALLALALLARAAPLEVENDWPQALAVARAEGRPIFVDAWAPW
ncbi:MAG TPA: hypothetical protein VLV17_03610 [Anaeromyxobacteraceae bacterium]|nr:hypothetical protein [Anaeromyxobacteraceae bacterium]